MTRVLQLSAYRRLLAAYSLNELALSIGSLALAVLVYRRTGSAIGAAAFFLSSRFVPALLSPALVARIDQRSVRAVLSGLYVFEALTFAVLAWMVSRFALAPVLALALFDGVLALAARAVARTATVTVTSPVGLLREGNAVTNAAFSVCFMAGPALGGAIVVAGGATAALLVNVGLFAAIALILVTASGLPSPRRERVSVAGRLRGALAYAAGRPAIRALLSLQAIALLFFTISIPVEVVFAQRSLHVGAGGYGGLLSAWGAGAVAGSAIYARWRSRPSRALISLGAGALGIGLVVMAVSPRLVPALIGAAVAGCGNGIEAVAARTALQEQVEEKWMAMMMSLNESMFQAVPGAGIVLGGALTALWNPRVALAGAGAGALFVAGLARLWLGPERSPAAGAHPPTPESSRQPPAAASASRH